MRRLKEQETGSVETAPKPQAVSPNDKWVPYDGNLEEDAYKVKERNFKDPNGDLRTIKETVLSKDGPPKYSVVGNELLEWRKGYGGTQRRHVCTFKASFPDTPDGRARASKQKSFRAMLKSKGIPGA